MELALLESSLPELQPHGKILKLDLMEVEVIKDTKLGLYSNLKSEPTVYVP